MLLSPFLPLFGCGCFSLWLLLLSPSWFWGAVFLRTSKSLESMDPQFTMRRKMEQLREELELMEQLREVSQA